MATPTVIRVFLREWLIIVCLSLITICPSISYAIDQDDVVGIWLFDEGKGESVKDSYNGHDGEIKGNLKWVKGKFGDALEFPGAGDSYVEIPHEDSLSLTTWSITSWIKVEDTGSWQGIVVKQGAGGPRNYALYVDKSTNVIAAWISFGGSQDITMGKKVLTDSNWHHAAATYDKKLMRVYVDGVLDGEKTITAKPTANTGPVRIGVFSPGESPTKGVIDEVGLFSSALVEEDIKAIMKRGIGIATGISAVSPAFHIATSWGKLKAGYKSIQ